MEVTVPVTGVDIGRLHHIVHRDEDGGQSIKLKGEGGDAEALRFHNTVFSEDRGSALEGDFLTGQTRTPRSPR